MPEITRTPGGKKLEEIRKQTGLPQYKVEMDSGIGIGNLGKYESGERTKPGKNILDRILNALDAKFTDRVEVMERFGYTMNTPAPTEEEVAWAAGICQPIMDQLPFPSYLLDIQGYMIAWNYYVPKLFGIGETRLNTIARRERLTLFQAFFHSGIRLADRMEHSEMFLAHTIGIIRQDWESLLDEKWCQALLKTTFAKYPEFKKFWDMAADHPIAELPARPLANLQVNSPIMGPVEFRIAKETMNRDKRFAVVYLIPANPATLDQCKKWNQSTEERRSL